MDTKLLSLQFIRHKLFNKSKVIASILLTVVLIFALTPHIAFALVGEQDEQASSEEQQSQPNPEGEADETADTVAAGGNLDVELSGTPADAEAEAEGMLDALGLEDESEAEADAGDTFAVATEAELKNAIVNAPAGESTVIIMTMDITLTSALVIPSGKIIVLKSEGTKTLYGATGNTINIASGAQLTLKDVVVTHRAGITGLGVTNNGTFILNSGAVANNTNTTTPGVVNNGTMVMNGGSITGNTITGSSGLGAGINNLGSFTFNGGTIANNTSYYYGGGLAQSGAASFVMNGGTITGNQSRHQGGAVYLTGGSFELQNGTITGNTCTVNSNGGVYIGNATFTMRGGSITGNRGESTSTTLGTGLYSTGSSSVVNIYGGSIDGNTGDGVYNTGTMNLLGGIVTNNRLAGIYNTGTFNMYGGEVTENHGSGIKNSTGTFTLYNGTISHNEATDGGGIYVYSGLVVIENGDVTENYASATGGGMFLASAGSVIIRGGRINDNHAGNSGGGIRMSTNSNVKGTFVMEGGEVSGNTAVYMGGGMYPTWTTMSITGGRICDNTAGTNGGGIYSNRAYITIAGGEISGNHAGTDGGGIYISHSSVEGKITINNCLIANNSAQGNGGGIHNYMGNEDTIIYGSTLTGNSANNGGGIYSIRVMSLGNAEITNNQALASGGGVYNGSLMTITGAIDVSGNQAVNGGGVYSTSPMDFGSLALLDNSASAAGGGMYLGGTSSMVKVNIDEATISGNSAQSGGGIYLVQNRGQVAIFSGEVSNNRAVGNGGGIWTSNAYASLTSATIAPGVEFFGNLAASGYDRNPADDKTYASSIGDEGEGVNWSLPFDQGYNNYDISYVRGTAAAIYMVSFMENGAEADSILALVPVRAQQAFDSHMPQNPSRDGYAFDGWNPMADGTGEAFDETWTITANLTVFAQWEEIEVIEPIVQFSAMYDFGFLELTDDIDELVNILDIESLEVTDDIDELASALNTEAKPLGEMFVEAVATMFSALISPADDTDESTTATLESSLSEAEHQLLEEQTGDILSDVIEGLVPLGNRGVVAAWSLLSLILVIANFISALAMAALNRSRSLRLRRYTLLRIAAMALGVMTLVEWVFLENVSLPMVWINSSTIYFAVLAMVELLIVIVSLLVHKPYEKTGELELEVI